MCKSLEDECDIQPIKLQLSTDATVKQVFIFIRHNYLIAYTAFNDVIMTIFFLFNNHAFANVFCQVHCIMSVLREQCVFVTEKGKLCGVITWKEVTSLT